MARVIRKIDRLLNEVLMMAFESVKFAILISQIGMVTTEIDNQNKDVRICGDIPSISVTMSTTLRTISQGNVL